MGYELLPPSSSPPIPFSALGSLSLVLIQDKLMLETGSVERKNLFSTQC